MGDRGIGLARRAMNTFRDREVSYPHGITVAELAHELELAGPRSAATHHTGGSETH